MITQKIPSLDITVSKLGFGAMRLPTVDKVIDQEHVNRMVAYAIEHGVNYFDTAFVYHGGKSEVALGQALAPYDRTSYFVASKMPFWDLKTPEDLDTTFNTTLERLGMDYIDFYLMHSLDAGTFEKLKSLNAYEWAQKKKAEGKIRHVGFSIHDNFDTLKAILDYAQWDFAQVQLNYLDLDDNPGLAGYEEITGRNIPLIIMEPLKGGILSDIPAEIAAPYARLGGTPVSFAFRWLAERPGIMTILSGMSNLEQIQQNIEVFANPAPLSDAEHDAIEQVCAGIKAAQKVPCTGCAYCMPCPAGVEIPALFKAWNTLSMRQNTNWVSGTFIDKKNAAQCVSCMQCTSHCPQHINIPEKLQELAQ